jgi:hypothetical protein
LKQGLTVALDQTDQLPGTDNHDTQPHLRKWQSTDSKKMVADAAAAAAYVDLTQLRDLGRSEAFARLSAAVHVSRAQVRDI